uniref:Mucin-22-like n=1 Tax=Saccoglossus kowalevskii TaxID=10224 RepID=A0ABM0MZ60_SACKO|nr:PREDICTED: mucin-22-like [Saccoglossus kowalevskii]
MTEMTCMSGKDNEEQNMEINNRSMNNSLLPSKDTHEGKVPDQLLGVQHICDNTTPCDINGTACEHNSTDLNNKVHRCAPRTELHREMNSNYVTSIKTKKDSMPTNCSAEHLGRKGKILLFVADVDWLRKQLENEETSENQNMTTNQPDNQGKKETVNIKGKTSTIEVCDVQHEVQYENQEMSNSEKDVANLCQKASDETEYLQDHAELGEINTMLCNESGMTNDKKANLTDQKLDIHDGNDKEHILSPLGNESLSDVIASSDGQEPQFTLENNGENAKLSIESAATNDIQVLLEDEKYVAQTDMEHLVPLLNSETIDNITTSEDKETQYIAERSNGDMTLSVESEIENYSQVSLKDQKYVAHTGKDVEDLMAPIKSETTCDDKKTSQNKTMQPITENDEDIVILSVESATTIENTVAFEDLELERCLMPSVKNETNDDRKPAEDKDTQPVMENDEDIVILSVESAAEKYVEHLISHVISETTNDNTVKSDDKETQLTTERDEENVALSMRHATTNDNKGLLKFEGNTEENMKHPISRDKSKTTSDGRETSGNEKTQSTAGNEGKDVTLSIGDAATNRKVELENQKLKTHTEKYVVSDGTVTPEDQETQSITETEKEHVMVSTELATTKNNQIALENRKLEAHTEKYVERQVSPVKSETTSENKDIPEGKETQSITENEEVNVVSFLEITTSNDNEVSEPDDYVEENVEHLFISAVRKNTNDDTAIFEDHETQSIAETNEDNVMISTEGEVTHSNKVSLEDRKLESQIRENYKPNMLSVKEKTSKTIASFQNREATSNAEKYDKQLAPYSKSEPASDNLCASIDEEMKAQIDSTNILLLEDQEKNFTVEKHEIMNEKDMSVDRDQESVFTAEHENITTLPR